MTIKEIKQILTQTIKDDWIKFANAEDKAYFLQSIKQSDKESLGTIFGELEVSEITEGRDFIIDMAMEYDNLLDQ